MSATVRSVLCLAALMTFLTPGCTPTTTPGVTPGGNAVVDSEPSLPDTAFDADPRIPDTGILPDLGVEPDAVVTELPDVPATADQEVIVPPDAGDEVDAAPDTGAEEIDSGSSGSDADLPDTGCNSDAATVEVCNGLDDDCNGLTDDGAALCDDGDACTAGEACLAGKCALGNAITCVDDNPCTDDGCDPKAGCAFIGNTSPCDDGNPCSTGDTCKAAACVGGPAKTCNDDNPCTDDSCDPTQGCVAVPNAATCDDGNACSTGDHCQAGACQAGENSCECQVDADCPPPQNLCLGKVFCNKSGAKPACALQPGSGVTCDASQDTVCTTNTCNPATAKCGLAPINQGLACNDGSACTVGDVCQGGTCKPGEAAACNDGNPCTTDTCNTKTGCQHAPGTNPCDDGNACTISDLCNSGACVPGAAKTCDDGIACTADACDPKTGACTADAGALTGKPCNGTEGACAGAATCQAGACKAGPAVSCNDNNPCTTDGCVPASGCTHSAVDGPCTDNDLCTDDACAGGKCVGVAKICADGNPCTTDSCTASTGACSYLAIPGCGSRAQSAWGGAFQDQFWAVRALPDGGAIAAGESQSWGAGSGDILVVRTDACGHAVWGHTYGGPGKDVAFDVRPTADGGFLVAGTSYGSDPAGNMYVLRLDGTGKVIWAWSGGGSAFDFAKSISPTQDGGCILAGKTYSFGPNTPDVHNAMAVKLDANGKLEWSRVYAAKQSATVGNGSMDISAIAEVKDASGKWSGFLAVGGSEGYGVLKGGDDIWLMRLAADGTHLWSVAYGGNGDDDAQTGFVQTADNGFAVGFWETGFQAQSSDIGLLKTDANGKLQWFKRYSGAGKDEPYGLALIGTDFVMTGFTNSWSAGDIDGFLIRIDGAGEVTSLRTFGGVQDQSAQGVAVTADGGFVLVGRTNAAGKGAFDAWLVKTAADGAVGCSDKLINPLPSNTITPTATWFTPVLLTAGTGSLEAGVAVGNVDVTAAFTNICPCK